MRIKLTSRCATHASATHLTNEIAIRSRDPINVNHTAAYYPFFSHKHAKWQSLVGLNSRELSTIDFTDETGRERPVGGPSDNTESSSASTPLSARLSARSMRRLPLRVPQDFPTLVCTCTCTCTRVLAKPRRHAMQDLSPLCMCCSWGVCMCALIKKKMARSTPMKETIRRENLETCMFMHALDSDMNTVVC